MKSKTELFRLPEGVIACLELNSVEQIMRDKGIDPRGDVQKFHTQNVLRRIQRYMPYRSGMTIKVMIAQTDVSRPEIILDVPYGKYLFYGKAMEGAPPKAVTDRDLHYTKTKNPKAGPRWDRALSAAEGAQMADDLRRYIKRKG